LFLAGSCIDALHTYLKAVNLVRDRQKAPNSNNETAPASSDLCKLEIDLLNNCAAACLALNVTEGAALAAAYAGKSARVAQAAGDQQRAQKALLREGKALLEMHRCVRARTTCTCNRSPVWCAVGLCPIVCRTSTAPASMCLAHKVVV
jgi:hypothetical protein